MDEGTAAGPKRNGWSRPDRQPAEPAETAPDAPGPPAPAAEQDAATREFTALPTEESPGAPAPAEHGDASGATPAAGSGAPPAAGPRAPAPPPAPPRQQPLHPQDPYGTPPYGDPGPWAPAPPVQRPMATPPQGTGVPPHQPYPAPPQAPAGQVPPQSHGGPAARTPMPQSEPPAPREAPPAGHDTALPAAAEGSLPPAVPLPAVLPHDASGAPLPPEAHDAPSPAQPQQAPADGPGHWQQYDPWQAPRHGAPMPLGTPPPPPPKPRSGGRGKLAAGAVALALLAGGVGGGVGAYIERNGGLGAIELPQSGGDRGGRKPDSVAGIAQAALPSVVTLHVRGNSEQGTGTGFVLDKQGHILTNNHVVEPAGTGGEISVSFSGGETAKAKVIGRDGGYDLAVVKVEGVSGLRPLALGDSDSVRVGDPVVAIGAPYDLANTVTAGIISAKQRPITAGGKKGDGSDVSYVDALQTDAPINPGNSGGPLVDSRARVIGINSAIRAAGSGGDGLEGGSQGGSIGLGFAIPINQGKWVAEELINKGKVLHPVIGVTLEMEYAGDGARVSAKSKDGGAPVTPGGPGAKAGIEPRDVITKVDGQPVHSGEELIVKVRSHRPGDRLTLTLRRDGRERTAQLTLGAASQG
ncbi:trypsin-like peptidase domain-containing protein [Streptomyces sp. NPDC017056]|uniref:trypsin-like peptidase domain-containing protein n=1 Tax=Streptomyces sp. NPDC017056 TaxID=3364973 RepID=UPI0037AED50D